MPEIGEIKKGSEIGKSNSMNSQKYIYHSCILCGKQRWTIVTMKTKEPKHYLCGYCAVHLIKKRYGENSKMWRGGKFRKSGGYIAVYIKDDPFWASMASLNGKCYVFEHRLVMAKHLGRCLQQWEIVHHKNGIKDDNRIENLELSSSGEHILSHSRGYKDGYTKGLIDGRNKQIQELKEQNTELLKHIKLIEWQLNERLKALELGLEVK